MATLREHVTSSVLQDGRHVVAFSVKRIFTIDFMAYFTPEHTFSIAKQCVKTSQPVDEIVRLGLQLPPWMLCSQTIGAVCRVDQQGHRDELAEINLTYVRSNEELASCDAY